MPDEGTPKPNIQPEQNEKIDLRILVADDEELIRGPIQEVLSEEYSCVESVTDGAELVKKVLEEGRECDFIVTDNNMREMDGIEAVRRIRAAGYNMPIIILTAFDSDSLKSEIESLGAICMSKPIRLNELKDAIKRIRLEIQSRKK
ncbi:MAG: Response regulator [Candidatus Nomurabacteria bacterium GW2011_GWB1_43_7]|uniref:Response regulator n=1 Tax=Candidatus Nomurabacteria bacterium GW2011_GWB1_43_7 TaxID=1618747 RepID=A0A0G1I450_9BACT|nr:MAG: Response regulator [Candidatus Nomurabacteria bacterium GW2011_GWB1_43_7]